MHKLVFEEDALPDGTALAYYVRGQVYIQLNYIVTFWIALLLCCNRLSFKPILDC